MELTFQMKLNKWSLSEIDDLLPYEFEIYTAMMSNHLKEQNEELERSKRSR